MSSKVVSDRSVRYGIEAHSQCQVEQETVRELLDRRPKLPRSKAYNPEEALDAAMRTFWQQGYASTSVTDLTAAMGINKFSLYSGFGEKRAVFLAALDHYSATVVAELLSILDVEEGAFDAIRSYFQMLIKGATDGGECTGCLMTISASELASVNRQVRRKVQRHFARIKSAFIKVLNRGVEDGEISHQANVDVLSTHLMMCTQSIATLARTKPKPDEFAGYVDQLMLSLE